MKITVNERRVAEATKMPTRKEAEQALRKALEKSGCKVLKLSYGGEQDWVSVTTGSFDGERRADAFAWKFVATVLWPEGESAFNVDESVAEALYGLVSCDADVGVKGARRSEEPSGECYVDVLVAPPAEVNIKLAAEQGFTSYLWNLKNGDEKIAVEHLSSQGKSPEQILAARVDPRSCGIFHSYMLRSPVFGLTYAKMCQVAPESHAEALVLTEKIVAPKQSVKSGMTPAKFKRIAQKDMQYALDVYNDDVASTDEPEYEEKFWKRFFKDYKKDMGDLDKLTVDLYVELGQMGDAAWDEDLYDELRVTEDDVEQFYDEYEDARKLKAAVPTLFKKVQSILQKHMRK